MVTGPAHRAGRLAAICPELVATALLALLALLQFTEAWTAVDPTLGDYGRLDPGLVRDLSRYVPAGLAILSGRWDQVYVDPEVQVGPLALVIDATVVTTLGSSAAGWAVVRFVIIWAFLLTATLLSRPAGSPRRPRVVGVLLAAALVVVQYAVDFFVWGRWWYLPVLLLLLAAGRCAAAERWLPAGALLAVAIVLEPFAALGIVVLLLSRRLRTVALAAATAVTVSVAAYLPFAASGTFAATRMRWPVSTGTWAYLIHGPDFASTWSWRLVQAVVATMLAAAVVLSMRRRVPMPALAILAAATVPLGRLVTESWWWSYHWYVAAVFLAAGALRLAWLALPAAVPVSAAAWVGVVVAPISAPLASGIALFLLALTGWISPRPRGRGIVEGRPEG